LTALALLSVLLLLYSVIILQEILFGFIVVLGFWVFYLLYLAVLRLGRIATALETIAASEDQQTTSAGRTED